MVIKIKGEFYLNRAEAISYILQAYHAKWCFARWSRDEMAFSFETKDGIRDRILLPAYKSKKNRTVRIRKLEIDEIFKEK